MRFGIVGIEQSGKTTLFNAVTNTSGEVGQGYGRMEANLSIVKVPDKRLDRLHELYPTAKKTHATIEYLDVGGLAKGSTQRKGFQEQFLGNLRNVNALLCVLRNFESEAVPHAEGSVDPRRDWEIIEAEFLLSDMAIVEGRIEKLTKEAKKVRDDSKQKELGLLHNCLKALETEKPIRDLELGTEDEKLLRGFQFLTAKPILLVLNNDEEAVESEAQILEGYADLAGGAKTLLVCLSAKLEMEIAQLPEEDKETFRKEMGIDEPALHKMIRYSYDLLGVIPFFTAGDKEVRAWTIGRNTRAQAAAGEIHSDIERGFIRAEVVNFSTLSDLGSLLRCKEQGELRLEGKNYIVRDGEVITFRFNV